MGAMSVRRLIDLGDLASGVIKLAVPVPLIANQTVASDSTGVKLESGKFKIYTQNLDSLIIRASWTASATDSVVAIELYDVDVGSVVGSVSGNAGTDTESSDLAGSITDGHKYELRVNVTTASGTSGATTTVDYALIEMTFKAK